MLKDNVDSIDETGNLPFDILKPVIKMCPETQISILNELCREYSKILVILTIPQFALGPQMVLKSNFVWVSEIILP